MAIKGTNILRSNLWARQWLKSLESYQRFDEKGRRKGVARSGNVRDMQICPGIIRANVKGSRKSLYKVDIRLNTLSRDEWEKVLDALSDKAIFSAKMLAGEIPDSIEEVFTSLDVSLFPRTAGELTAGCTCGDEAKFCTHVEAVYHALALEFARNPFALFRLRGMDKDQIIEAIRKRRITEPETVMAENEDMVGDEEFTEADDQGRCSQLASQSYVNYWTGRMKNNDIKFTIEPSLVEQSILKRLGEPPFFAGKMDMMRQLERDYKKILFKAITVGHKE